MKLREAKKHVLDEATDQWVWKNSYFVNDVEVSEEEYRSAWEEIKALRERRGNTEDIFGSEVGTTHRPACWPLESTAMAVHPDQVEESNAVLAQHGCKSYHDKRGRLIIPSNQERKKVFKMKSGDQDFVDFDSFS